MPSFKIAVDLSEILPLGSALDASSFPNLAYAVRMIVQQAQANWQAYAQGAPLPDGRVINARTGTYLRSINMRMDGDFAGEAYSNLPYASAIEEGMPERDLKEILGRSLKVRISKAGKRYLIIPFRHFTPGSVQALVMPNAVHDWWQDPGRKRSSVVGVVRRVSGTGAYDIKTRAPLTVRQRVYKWGDRLTKDDLAGMGVGEKEARRLAGMVNFRKPKNDGTDGVKHSKYFTFRVMSEDSKGWIAKAVPGYFPARTVADNLRPVAERAFAAAVAADVKALFGAP